MNLVKYNKYTTYKVKASDLYNNSLLVLCVNTLLFMLLITIMMCAIVYNVIKAIVEFIYKLVLATVRMIKNSTEQYR